MSFVIAKIKIQNKSEFRRDSGEPKAKTVHQTKIKTGQNFRIQSE